MRTAAEKCAICGKPGGDRFRPFCSARCADIDLGRWLGESYAIPVVAEGEEDAKLPIGEKSADI